MSEHQEPLVLKVMRLRRPHLEGPRATGPLLAAGAGPGLGLAGAEMPKLLLPMALTQSLVGEPFTGYLHVSNVSTSPVNNVSLKVELQINQARFILFSSTQNPVASLAPGDFCDATVEYELRDAGTYVLSCHVTYSPAAMGPGELPSSFKRSYRFPAMLPFAVAHKVVQRDSELIVESAVENAQSGSLYLSGWRFDPPEGFEAQLVGGGGGGGAGAEGGGAGSSTHLLKPRGSHSLVFRVSPKEPCEDPVARVRQLEHVGSLALGWHVPDGPAGFAEGHQVRVRPASGPPGPLDLRVAACPGSVRVEEPFRLEVEVFNRAAKPAEPSLVFDARLMGGVRIHGATQHAVGRIEPHSSLRVPLDFLVAAPGLHGLQGVTLVDGLSNARTDFGSLCDILAF